MPETKPIFSICIPAYKDKEALERAIAHLKKQTFPHWECLIGDDTPQTALLTNECDPRIIYQHNTPSLGVPKNWNHLLLQAQGDYITLLHHDDFYEDSQLLEKVQTAFQQQKSAIVVCSYSIWKGGKRDAHYIIPENHIMHFLRDVPQRSLVINRIGHPSVLFFQASQCLPFDNNLTYFLDTDWYARLWKKGKSRVSYLTKTSVGMELGRTHQLSLHCMQNFSAILQELEYVLQKHHATPIQRAQAYARFFASHIRQASQWRASFFKILRSFTREEQQIFWPYFFVCGGHMLYRLLRKKFGFTAWR